MDNEEEEEDEEEEDCIRSSSSSSNSNSTTVCPGASSFESLLKKIEIEGKTIEHLLDISSWETNQKGFICPGS
ncbi:hypothetical protein M0804_012797 [Polistes exclamans]|nr:hypothetical protein M0804_012797 [Polistes exclamans]